MTHGIGMAPLASRQGDVNAPARVTPAVRASRARVTRPRSRTHAPARPRAAPPPPRARFAGYLSNITLSHHTPHVDGTDPRN